MTLPDHKQYKELMKIMYRPGDRDDTLNILRGMPELPSNEEEFLDYLRSKIQPHAEMWGQNKVNWRRNFFTVLPFRQCKRWMEKHLGQPNHFRQLIASLHINTANKTSSWGFKEFWQHSLMQKCVCGATNAVNTSEEHQRTLRFSCPEVEEDHKELLQGRTALEVRSFVLNASLYRLLKLGTKWRVYREPAFELLWKSGQQFFKLAESSEPSVGRRQQNVRRFLSRLSSVYEKYRISIGPITPYFEINITLSKRNHMKIVRMAFGL